MDGNRRFQLSQDLRKGGFNLATYAFVEVAGRVLHGRPVAVGSGRDALSLCPQIRERFLCIPHGRLQSRNQAGLADAFEDHAGDAFL